MASDENGQSEGSSLGPLTETLGPQALEEYSRRPWLEVLLGPPRAKGVACVTDGSCSSLQVTWSKDTFILSLKIPALAPQSASTPLQLCLDGEIKVQSKSDLGSCLSVCPLGPWAVAIFLL